MGIQRADTLFPVNSAVVDSGAGIDIRLLAATQPLATDSDQSVRFTHTQDGQERTFDPDNALVTTEADASVFQGEGWALRLAEDMTPVDDTNCDAVLTAGFVDISLRCLLSMNGGTNTGGNTEITFRVSLWRYNVSSNTGVFIAGGSQATTWNTSALGGENNTRKTTFITPEIPNDIVFGANEVLLLQIGCEGTTLPNATLGTTNFDITLDVDDVNTFLEFDVGDQFSIGMVQHCALTHNLIGKGAATRVLAGAISRSIIGKGIASATKATIASKTFSLVGKGVVTRNLSIALNEFNLVGVGTSTFTRAVVAAKSFTLVGKGTVSKESLEIGIPRTLEGRGTITSAKATIASKTFTLEGVGTITEAHPVQAFRTFNLVGKGEILISGENASTITIPIDEVPTGGGGGTAVVKRLYIFDD